MTAEDPRPLLAGVCGDPIGHSKSPVLFEHWFSVHRIAGRYVPLLIREGDFPDVILGLRKAGFRGCNVTLPHKHSALAVADTVTEAALRIGASNTLIFSQDGTVSADNSDWFGFIENLRAEAPDWSARSGPAVLLGAGGAARAAIHALLDAGVPEIRLTNRTMARAEEVAAHFGDRVQAVEWSQRNEAMDGAQTIVNTTSLGMTGQAPLDVSLEAAPPTAIVHDIVYKPLITPLLAAAAVRGLKIVDGLGMLLHQARPGFRAWFGQDPVVTPELRQACLEDR